MVWHGIALPCTAQLTAANAGIYRKKALVYAFKSKDTVIVFKAWVSLLLFGLFSSASPRLCCLHLLTQSTCSVLFCCVM
jgi:hypothetical protein